MTQELIQALVQEAHTPITAGISDKEAAQVERLFAVLLRSILETIFATPVQQKEAIARQTAKDLTTRIVSIPPQERVDYLIKEKLVQDLRLLDAKAFSAVRQLLAYPDQRGALVPQATKVLEELDRIKEKIASMWPDQPERYGRILSEAALDCQYVLGPTHITSLRLGRLLKTRKKL